MSEYIAFSANDFPHIKKLVLDCDSHGVGHSRKLETLARILDFRSLNALRASMTKKTETYVINYDAGVHFLLGTDPATGTSHLNASMPEARLAFEIYKTIMDQYPGRDPRPESLVYLTDELRRLWSNAEKNLKLAKGGDAGASGHLHNHPNNRPEFYVRCKLRHLDPNSDKSPFKIMEISYWGAHLDMDIERMRKSLDAVEALAAELDILMIPIELNFVPEFANEVKDRGYGIGEFGQHLQGAMVKAFGPKSTRALQHLERSP